MMPTDAQLLRLADALLAALLQKDLVELKDDSASLRERFVTVLRRNFREEETLESEAESFVDKHRREMVGMDRSKMVALVKQRLARERGFVL